MKVLLTGGGTGGHIYPALALMRRLKEVQPDTEFLYVGTERGLESTIVPDHGVAFKAVQVEGFKRKLNVEGIKYNLNTIRLFLSSIGKSKKILKEFNPDVVVGTGGYVCAPVCYAASKLNIPTVIHEQNSVAGVTNKFLGRYVDKIAICFEEAREQFKGQQEKIVLTGNPRAQEVAGTTSNGELKEYGLNPEKKTVLIFGGSRGANRINETFIEAYGELMKKDYQTLFATGDIYFETIREEISGKYDPTVNPEHVKIVPYIKNMPEVFAGVSLVVGRSGATSLAELTALGMPSILIPSPNVTEDHQTKNALSLVNHQAARMIKETELTKESFIEAIDEVIQNDEQLNHMSQQAKKMGHPYASDELIQVMLESIKG